MKLNHDRTTWLQGHDADCLMPPAAPARPVRLVLLGAPGVGKGTQAELLSDTLGACHLSTGDIFRAARRLHPAGQTPAMHNAMEAMHKGELVSDETVLAIVRERVRCLRCSGGFLLDGFPRTVVQAEALESLFNWERIALTGVINYQLPLDIIVARLSGRRTCADCKAVFHISSLRHGREGICAHCGGALVQREDDCPEAVHVRMAACQKSAQPLIDFYKQRGILITIQAEGAPELVLERTLAALNVDVSLPTH